MLHGMDVSHWQTRAQLEQAIKNDASLRFVIIKASEGVTYKDPSFAGHFRTAEACGIELFGAYHYARPERHGSTGRKEADHFISACEGYWGRLVPCLDFEGVACNYSPEWCLEWLDRIYEVTGLRGVIYTGTDYAKKCKVIADKGYGLWLARWVSELKPTHRGAFEAVKIWQYTSKPYDFDKFFGSKEDWLDMTMPAKSSVPAKNVCPTCGRVL